jgi:hypothetical protein
MDNRAKILYGDKTFKGVTFVFLDIIITTLNVVFNVTYYLELCNAISIYYILYLISLVTKVTLDVRTLYNINIFTR